MSLNIFDTDQIEQNAVPIFQDMVGALSVPADVNTDIRVIRGEQDKPRPQERSYVQIRITNFSQIGREIITPQEGSTLIKVAADWRVELRVRAIGGRAKSTIACILFALNRDDYIQRLACDASLAYSIHTDAIHVPALINEVFEERSQSTIVFFHKVEQEVDLGCIEKVDTLDGIYRNQGGDIVLTTSTIVP